MGKRHHPKKRASTFLRISIISITVGMLVFVAGNVLLKPQIPCANSLTCTDLSEKIENGALGMFQGQKVAAPNIDIALDNTESAVLGENVQKGEKHIYVDLSSQTLYAYQGNTKIMQAIISSGRWGRTPTGNFNIWIKLRSTRMSGGSGSDYYNLPNVPFVMYFYGDFGLHGAYWHNNFGYPMSHGCVNMRQIDAEQLYNWADGPAKGKRGTAVSVCDSFTGPNTCVQENPVN